MAYRKTPEILAGIARRKERMLDATIARIARDGIERVTIADIATRARLATGLAYKYFPDKDEMIAQALGRVLAADREAIHEAWGPRGVLGLANVIKVFYGRLKHPRLARALMNTEHYRRGVEDELAKLVGEVSDLPPNGSRAAAGAILGLLYGLYTSSDGNPRQARVAASFALRVIGLSEASASKVLERV